MSDLTIILLNIILPVFCIIQYMFKDSYCNSDDDDTGPGATAGEQRLNPANVHNEK